MVRGCLLFRNVGGTYPCLRCQLDVEEAHVIDTGSRAGCSDPAQWDLHGVDQQQLPNPVELRRHFRFGT